MPHARIWITSSLVALASLAACASDDGTEPECNPSLEEWCAEARCNGFETLDEALVSIADSSTPWGLARGCGGRVIASLGTGYVAQAYLYDLESGELLGGARSSDIATNDTCEVERATAGEPVTCEDASCQLIGHPLDPTADVEPCTDTLGASLEQQCLDDVPPMVAGCEACACPACYPLLLRCGEYDGSLCASLAGLCLIDNCLSECETQLRAIEEAMP